MTLAIAIAANLVLMTGLLALLAYAMSAPARLRPHAAGRQPVRDRRTVRRARPVRGAPYAGTAAVAARA
jgi:hypothetical protein